MYFLRKNPKILSIVFGLFFNGMAMILLISSLFTLGEKMPSSAWILLLILITANIFVRYIELVRESLVQLTSTSNNLNRYLKHSSFINSLKYIMMVLLFLGSFGLIYPYEGFSWLRIIGGILLGLDIFLHCFPIWIPEYEDATLTGTTIQSQSGPASDDDEEGYSTLKGIKIENSP